MEQDSRDGQLDIVQFRSLNEIENDKQRMENVKEKIGKSR